MSLPHFFLDEQIIARETQSTFELQLSPDDAKHARVLRLASGEHIAVVDAASDYFECRVEAVASGSIMVRVAQHLDAPARPQVVLLQGLAKGDKMDTVLRHATELGISEFIPLVCERSVVRLDAKKTASRLARWRSIAKSAAMQSGRASVPEVCEPLTVRQACAELGGATALLVCWEEAPQSMSLPAAIQAGLRACSCQPADARIAVVVGPEGGLTQAEVDAFLACNERASMVSLGSSILRTETAGIVAPALVLYELEAHLCA